MRWLRQFWLSLWHSRQQDELLPPPDRSVKRNAQIFAEMAQLRARLQRES